MFAIKPIERDAVPRALEKAERYRLLNEPEFAESICQDVLAVEPDNQQALVTYLLALSDQIARGGQGQGHNGPMTSRARSILPRLEGEYNRCYYAGLLAERQGHGVLAGGGAGAGVTAYEHLREAMERYERAHALRPAGNDDAVLRYNTCVRTIEARGLQAPPPDPIEYPGDL